MENDTVSNRPIRRTDEVRVKLHPEVSAEFRDLAEERGLPSATLAAAILGEWLVAQRTKRKIEQMVAIDASKRMTSPEFIEGPFSNALEDVLRRLGLHAPAESEGEPAEALSSAVPQAAADGRTDARSAAARPPERARNAT